MTTAVETTYKNLLIETRGPVTLMKVNRPEVLNALNRQTLVEIEDFAPVDGAKIRYAPRAPADWTTMALTEPDGRALVRWLLGLPEEGKTQ